MQVARDSFGRFRSPYSILLGFSYVTLNPLYKSDMHKVFNWMRNAISVVTCRQVYYTDYHRLVRFRTSKWATSWCRFVHNWMQDSVSVVTCLSTYLRQMQWKWSEPHVRKSVNWMRNAISVVTCVLVNWSCALWIVIWIEWNVSWMRSWPIGYDTFSIGLSCEWVQYQPKCGRKYNTTQVSYGDHSRFS